MNTSVNSEAPLRAWSCYSYGDEIKNSSISAGELFHITDWEGTLSTPDYPQTYPINSDLTWIKIVSPGNKVKITIQDFEVKNTENLITLFLSNFCLSY